MSKNEDNLNRNKTFLKASTTFKMWNFNHDVEASDAAELSSKCSEFQVNLLDIFDSA
jgi:hypothetical protein